MENEGVGKNLIATWEEWVGEWTVSFLLNVNVRIDSLIPKNVK